MVETLVPLIKDDPPCSACGPSHSPVHEYQLRTTSARSTGRPSLTPETSMVARIPNGNSSPILEPSAPSQARARLQAWPVADSCP
ncbi:hypothetical protein VTN02DRAFT_3983 [Thermoascus thermophilus]